MNLRRLVGVGALCVTAAFMAPTPAQAQAEGQDYYVDYVGRPSPRLEQTYVDPDVTVLGTTTTRDAMPITGGDLLGLAALGLGGVGVGYVLVRRSRTRGTTA